MKIRDIINTNPKKEVEKNKYNITLLQFDRVHGLVSAIVTRKPKSYKDLTRQYRVYIDYTVPLTLDSDVKVSCDCPDFNARWKYVLYKKGGLFMNTPIIAQNPLTLELEPKVRNPSQKIGVCKHISMVLEGLLNIS